MTVSDTVTVSVIVTLTVFLEVFVVDLENMNGKIKTQICFNERSTNLSLVVASNDMFSKIQ